MRRTASIVSRGFAAEVGAGLAIAIALAAIVIGIWVWSPREGAQEVRTSATLESFGSVPVSRYAHDQPRVIVTLRLADGTTRTVETAAHRVGFCHPGDAVALRGSEGHAGAMLWTLSTEGCVLP